MTWFPGTYLDWLTDNLTTTPDTYDSEGVLVPLAWHSDRLPEKGTGKTIQVKVNGEWVSARLLTDVEDISDSISGGAKWALQATWRGWIRDGLLSYIEFAQALGAPQTHLDAMPDIGGLEDKRAAKLQAVKSERDRRANSTCSTPAGTVQCDESSRINMTGAAVAAQLAIASSDTAWSMDWILEDNSVVTLNAAQLIAMANAVGNHVRDCFARGEVLKVAVTVANDIAALEAIDITTGWPA